MKLLKSIPIAAIALTALIPLKTNAGIPNGWTQKGQRCGPQGGIYYKAQENTDTSQYGVWNNAAEYWKLKYVTKEEANVWLNKKCNTNIYQPTS